MIEITIPRLGWSMEEGTFSAWLKQQGEWVEKGDLLFVLESDKASQEIESFEAGLLHLVNGGPQPGDTVAVGQVIGYLTARDEVPSPDPSPKSDQSPKPKVQSPKLHAAPLATASAAPEITSGNVTAGDVEPGRVASPRARRAASTSGIDWRTLTGTGRGGRIRERDVLSAAGTTADMRPAASPLSSVRRIIAERMLASVRSTAPVTLTTKVDAANLVNLRRQFKAASAEAAPTITDLVLKLAAKALENHPDLNARWHDNKIVRNSQINIGFAVDTPAGLMVPVIHDVASLRLKQVAALSRSLVERAREGRLKAEDMERGTFTVTNLGMYGIDAFTPIINPPETAVLGLGAVRREAIVLDDERLAAGHVLTLSLTFDHRVVDGAPAARFLQALGKLIENPAASLVE